MDYIARLRALRAQAGLSQRRLDEAAGLATSTTGRIESGHYRLGPARDICDRLDAGLGVPRGTMWSAVARERLQKLDPDIYHWHEEQLSGDRELASVELELVEEARLLDESLDLPTGTVAGRVGDLLSMLGVEIDGSPEHDADSPASLTCELLSLVSVMERLPPEVQLRVLSSVRETLRLATTAARVLESADVRP